MSISEIGILLVIYSGLMTFFLVPFQRQKNVETQTQTSLTFQTVFKNHLVNMIFHRKALFAYLLFGFTLCIIWFGYDAEEVHYNAHSGYPSISTDFQALFVMGLTIIYSIVLCLFLALIRTVKTIKPKNRNR